MEFFSELPGIVSPHLPNHPFHCVFLLLTMIPVPKSRLAAW